MTSQYCIHIEITIDQPDFFEDLPDSCYSHYFMIGELLEENVSLFIDACLCNSEIMSGLYQEVGLFNISFYFEVFELVCFNDVPIPAKYNLSYIKTPELKQAIEELRLRYCALDNKKTIPIDDDSPAVLPDSIVDDKDQQDKVQDYCLKLELYDGGFPSDVAIRYIGKLYQSQIESFRKRCLIELKGLLQSEIIRCYYNGLLETPSSPKLFLSMLPFKELTSEQEAVLDCSFGDDVIDKLESIRKECFNSVQFTSAVVAPAVSDSPAVPASVPVDKESSAVLFVPEFDGSNDWIKTSEMAQEMVNNEISIDIEAAKKHLRNMKSNGKKSAEKYDGKNSTYGEINISSFQVKWRMVRNGGKWNVYFYRPSLKWEQK